jgi:hypothetical protein
MHTRQGPEVGVLVALRDQSSSEVTRTLPPFGAHPLAFMMPSRSIRDRALWAGAALRTVARRPSEPQS